MRLALMLAAGVALAVLGCTETGLPPDGGLPVEKGSDFGAAEDLGLTRDLAISQLPDLATSPPADLGEPIAHDMASPLPPSDVAMGPALNLSALRLAAGEFDLAGVAPDGSFAVVITHDMQSELQVYDAVGKLLAQLDGGAKVLSVAAGGNLYYSVGTTLRAWWPARGAGNAITLSTSLKYWIGASPDGMWVLFRESPGQNSEVVRYGRRDQALETIPNATNAFFAPRVGHVYARVEVKGAPDRAIRIAQGQPVAAAEVECTDCQVKAVSFDGSTVARVWRSGNDSFLGVSSSIAAASQPTIVFMANAYAWDIGGYFAPDVPILVFVIWPGISESSDHLSYSYDYQQHLDIKTYCDGGTRRGFSYAGTHGVCTDCAFQCSCVSRVEDVHWFGDGVVATRGDQYALRTYGTHPPDCIGNHTQLLVVRSASSLHTLPAGADTPIVWTDPQHLLYKQGTTLMRLDMSGQTWTTSAVGSDVSDYLFNEPSRRLFFVTRGVSQQKDGLYVVPLP